MTTARNLQLILAIAILFGLFSLFAIIQLSKSIHLHHINYSLVESVSELSEELNYFPEVPLITDDAIKRLKKINTLQSECLLLLNPLDRYIMNMIKAEKIISVCENNHSFSKLLIEELSLLNESYIVDPIFVDSLNHAIKLFQFNAANFEEPINKFGEYTKQTIFWLFIPFAACIIIISIYILRKINLNTYKLHNAISALEKSEQEKEQLAYYDTLTSLPNRNLFSKLLEHEINNAKRYNNTFAILNIDLDRFKFINDTLGHDAGDELISQVSQRLKECTRNSDTVARFGGDEFLILISGPNSENDAMIVAKKIIKLTSEPFNLGENQMHISSSIGISSYPKNGDDVSTLLKHADIAMYEAKNSGKNQFCAFDNTIINKLEHRLTLEKDLPNSIENELLLYYQPLVDLRNFETVGVEALLRWQHKTKGMVSPIEFIPIAESIGLIDVIGEWVIEQACKQCSIWRKGNKPDFTVAVNVSARQLKNKNLPIFIEKILKKYSLPIDAIDIEITESVFYGDDKKAIANLNKLSEMGMRLFLDDFGTGYSSLSTLHAMPFDILKIDRNFMDLKHQKKRIISKTIIDMAKNFDLELIAEGVEDEYAINYLIENGCYYAQGYFFEKPIPAEKLDISKNYKSLVSTSKVSLLTSKKG